MNTSISNCVIVSNHIRPRVLYVGMDVKEYIHQGAAQSLDIDLHFSFATDQLTSISRPVCSKAQLGG